MITWVDFPLSNTPAKESISLSKDQYRPSRQVNQFQFFIVSFNDTRWYYVRYTSSVLIQNPDGYQNLYQIEILVFAQNLHIQGPKSKQGIFLVGGYSIKYASDKSTHFHAPSYVKFRISYLVFDKLQRFSPDNYII